MDALTTVWVCVGITLAALLIDALCVRAGRHAARRAIENSDSSQESDA